MEIRFRYMVFGYNVFNDKDENNISDDVSSIGCSNGYVYKGAKHGWKKVQIYNAFCKQKSRTYGNYLQERCTYLWHGVGWNLVHDIFVNIMNG